MSETANYDKHKALIDKLTAAGFVDGWALQEETLILWEHEEDPPKPLTHPK